MRRVVLTHAYSAGNSGDGLLVREAHKIVREAFPDCEVRVLSLDPMSFSDLQATHPLSGLTKGRRRLPILAKNVLMHSLHNEAKSTIESADLVVAVGGGYLRAGRPMEAFKSWVAHGPQLPNPELNTTYLYLPQSFGPFRIRPFSRHIRKLHKAAILFARDDRSVTELQRFGIKARRCPDLAVLAIAEMYRRPSTPKSGSSHFALVARSLDGRTTPQYESTIRTLASASNCELAAQSTSRGNNDLRFYRSLGLNSDVPALTQLLTSDNRPGVTVSVRLHGALESILLGTPAIHLSYERKGWGAYEDLGLLPYVHNARNADVNKIRGQILALAEEPETYWERIEQAIPRIRTQRGDLISSMRGVVS